MDHQTMENNNIQRRQTVAVLIDGNNVARGADTGMVVDYPKFIKRLVGGRTLSRLTYFQEGSIDNAFAHHLHEQFQGGVRSCKKSADVPLAMQAVQQASRVDAIILCSGDSDYVDLVCYLKAVGVQVEVAAFPHCLSADLASEADYSHYIKPADCKPGDGPERRTIAERKSDSKTSKSGGYKKKVIKNIPRVVEAAAKEKPEAPTPVVAPTPPPEPQSSEPNPLDADVLINYGTEVPPAKRRGRRYGGKSKKATPK